MMRLLRKWFRREEPKPLPPLPSMEGWYSWEFSPQTPYDHEFVLIQRRGSDEPPQIIDPRRMHPAFNVWDLYWKPWTGETIEAISRAP